MLTMKYYLTEQVNNVINSMTNKIYVQKKGNFINRKKRTEVNLSRFVKTAYLVILLTKRSLDGTAFLEIFRKLY